MRHLIDPLDFSQQEITSLLDLADRICADPAAYQDGRPQKAGYSVLRAVHPYPSFV